MVSDLHSVLFVLWELRAKAHSQVRGSDQTSGPGAHQSAATVASTNAGLGPLWLDAWIAPR